MSTLILILLIAATLLFFFELIGTPAKFSLSAAGGLCVCAALLIGHFG